MGDWDGLLSAREQMDHGNHVVGHPPRKVGHGLPSQKYRGKQPNAPQHEAAAGSDLLVHADAERLSERLSCLIIIPASIWTKQSEAVKQVVAPRGVTVQGMAGSLVALSLAMLTRIGV